MAAPEAFADAIVLAAGLSARMQGQDKLMISVEGRPLVAWTLAAVRRATTVRRIVLVAHPDRVAETRSWDWVREAGCEVVAGGARRQDSVAAGFDATDAEVVLIHDGARPLVSPQLVDRVALAAREHGAAVPLVEVPESMRRLVDGRVSGILDRTGLYRSQTPHGARREVFARAYERVDPRGPSTFVDETTLVQAAGIPVWTVPGEPENLKVTLRGDERLAVALLEARARELRSS
ncbi:IspD/TarI family cytidylyltransferase [Nocardioides aurantiacus]|uniref:2-C-methyl-D-erythritol 4-phosphate cytidylyltransferase n=1 Tax=Nocardioides aurantiacus TaxID=86796 RepID=A0A3N2CRK1_9ACTN|nr:IspD/TarI family cytidylyltransferase [Nocardioides aurantiacus]ROR90172.1 2-C-methyl-D-erythritol 4-phosphate cytidylyltransferase [Nocardioides aurantiacus]